MESNTRRVRAIFSVVANPVRLDIIQKLNMRGNMTYTELKALTGFKAKKESGKFAYHLRKLVKANLVMHYSSDKKYGVTPLGKAVLLLARQIGEQALAGGPRLLVHTSDGKVEEFASEKIIQSLVKEAGMALDLAYNLAGEIESTLLKFRANYVTTALIRELINAKLFEMNMEDYRHRLSRVGISIHDLTQALEGAATNFADTHMLSRWMAKRLLTEYVLHYRLPRHLAESHMAGDVGFSDLSSWLTAVDTLFIKGDLQGEAGWVFEVIPRSRALIGGGWGDSLPKRIIGVIACCLNEASREVVVDISALAGQVNEGDALAMMRQAHMLATTGGSTALLTLATNVPSEALLRAYRSYCAEVPVPLVALSLTLDKEQHRSKVLMDMLSEVFRAGGLVSLCSGQGPTSYLGIHHSAAEGYHIAGAVHGFSVNLVRLAFESEGDPSYFRSKLSMAFRLLAEAAEQRMRDLSRPTVGGAGSLTQRLVQRKEVTAIINLIGMQQATKVFGKGNDSVSLLQEVLGVGKRVFQNVDLKINYGLLFDREASRFLWLDYQKYGERIREEAGIAKTQDSYSNGFVIEVEGDGIEDKAKELRTISELVRSNVSVGLRLRDYVDDTCFDRMARALVSEIGVGKPALVYTACTVCSSKVIGNRERCAANAHTNVRVYSTF